MKLVVNSEGVYLTKVGECFCIKKDKNKQEIAAKKVEQILITTSAAISTDAIEHRHSFSKKIWSTIW